jgi:repressor LexA
MLTKKQKELLHFIQQRLEHDGVSPSFDEMKDALDLRSKSGIHRLIGALEERGFIRRLPHRARALEVVRLSEESAHRTVAVAAVPAATVIAGRSVDVPLNGRFAAGTPIEALRDPTRSVEVPVAMLGRGTCYALEVSGDSMTGAGIMDGDTVLIEAANLGRPNDIVVALVDREEATLKRFRLEGPMVLLEAANPAYPTRRLESSRVQVQGRLIGLLRQY